MLGGGYPLAYGEARERLRWLPACSLTMHVHVLTCIPALGGITFQESLTLTGGNEAVTFDTGERRTDSLCIPSMLSTDSVTHRPHRVWQNRTGERDESR